RDSQYVQESYLSHRAEVGLGLTDSSLKLSDVGGLDRCKKLLNEAAILPIEFPHFFTGNRKPWKAILLYGPPGTGKTLVANAIATDAGSAFFSVSASNIVSKWMGEGEKQVSNLFQSARDEAPSIIFIDEIDSLCGPRGKDNENEASRRIKTEFLVQMQAVSNDARNVLVLAATNTPKDLDVAMRRRFDKRIYIPLPTEDAREQIFRWHIGETNLKKEDFQYLVSKTDGFSGSDISICVKDALYQPVRATLDAKFFRKNSQGMWVPCKGTHPKAEKYTLEELKAKVEASKIQLPPIEKADFDYVLASQKPTVRKADLEVYEKFTKKYGIYG
ncbi:protein SUPPRESSOR OF K(+) TRANSPORT GROWTH DEFECT 1-like, partial [Quercus lobata]|uniref:protein SUPPRESSOR OF K(+) TRANSPORT GROWTH DEFECT 1-like n=1 Tax=Quercus lobata TaxID=97700 RepID=UPI0012492FF0